MKRKNVNYIEPFAYRDGTQGISQTDSERMTEAIFEQKREEETKAAADKIKNLEATKETLAIRKTDAEEHWNLMKAFNKGREPEAAKPLLAVFSAVALVVAEGWLLTPAMDGLSTTEFYQQWFVATAIVGAYSVWLKMAIHSYKQPQRKNWLIIAPAAFSIVALSVFGWWRGHEVIFAGLQKGNNFAATVPFLTIFFMTLTTIALPVGAAFALEYGVEKLRHFNEWKKARDDFFGFTSSLNKTVKQLEAENEKLARARETLAQKREEWLAAARQAHLEGFRNGAYKKPLRDVLLPIFWFALLVFAGVLIVAYIVFDESFADFIRTDVARFALYVMIATGITGVFAERVLKSWNRPTAEDLYSARVTHFENTTHPDATKMIVTAKSRGSNAENTDDEWGEETIEVARN